MTGADDRVAALLRTSAEPLPASDIARLVNISEEQVTQMLKELETAGAPLVAVPHAGWKLQGGPIFPGEIEFHCAGKKFGITTRVLRRTRSTNDLALRAGLDGAPNGSLFIAEEQEGGRGRQGRTWAAAPGENLLFSLLLRPEYPPARWSRLATLAALAVAETVDHFCHTAARIKWPNDVLVEGRKLCGILLESRTAEAGQGFVVIGIGLNVNQTAFPPELVEIATSMKLAADKDLDRTLVLAHLLQRLEVHCEGITTKFPSIVEQAWRRSSLAGRQVNIQTGHNTITGTASGISDEGGLIIRDESGMEKSFMTGEVVRVRNA